MRGGGGGLVPQKQNKKKTILPMELIYAFTIVLCKMVIILYSFI